LRKILIIIVSLILGIISTYVVTLFTMILTQLLVLFLPMAAVISRIFVAVLVTTLIFFLFTPAYSPSFFGLRFKGLGYGARLALLGLVCCSLPLFLIFTIPELRKITDSAPFVAVAASIVSVFCLAFTEEVIFRGFILNFLMQSLGKNRAGIYLALSVSGLDFALIHLGWGSWIDLPPLGLATIYIALFIIPFSIGVFLGALFLRTGNLLAASLFHGIHNSLLLLPDILREGENHMEAYSLRIIRIDAVSLSEVVLQALICLPVLVLGLWLIRRVPPIRAENDL
jgi:membrane protease YdiL (CAAX protease family)